MRLPVRAFAIMAALLGTSLAMHGQVVTLSGTVTESTGAPIAGAEVKLVCDSAPALSAETTTDAQGAYTFTTHAQCGYRLFAERGGVASASITLPMAAATPLVRNLVFPGTNVAADAPRPKFAASGIRGVIDPGGYSAPAGAAAASGMLAGMAGVKRNESSSESCVSSSTLAQLQEAHKRTPADMTATLDLAAAMLSRHDFAPAVEILRSMSPPANNVRFHQLLARAEEGTGEFLAAAEQYRLLGTMQPSDTVVFNQGFELTLAGRLAEAATVFHDGFIPFPRSAALHIGAGTAAFLQGKTDAAVSSFLRAAELDAFDPRPYPFLAAASAVQRLQPEGFRAAFDRHIAANPTDAPGLTAYASVLAHDAQGSTSDTNHSAQQLILRAIQLEPNLAEAHYQLGVIYARTGRDKEATGELRRAAKLDPHHAEAHYRLSQSLRKDGQKDEAEREMRTFQRLKSEQSVDGPDLQQYLSVMARPGDSAPVCAPSLP